MEVKEIREILENLPDGSRIPGLYDPMIHRIAQLNSTGLTYEQVMDIIDREFPKQQS